MNTTYCVVRFYEGKQPARREVLRTGLTLEDAQRHCGSKQTSSSTATVPKLVALTAKVGRWFDAYEEESRYPRKAGLLERGFRELARERGSRL